MKKFLLTFAALAFGFAAQAQNTITFTETKSAGELNNVTFKTADNNLSITTIDNAVKDGKNEYKFTIDSNTAYFDSPDGTYANATKCEYRLKTGGKSDSKRLFNGTVAKAGTIYIYARTGSNSDSNRNIIITQSEKTVLDVFVVESNSATSTDVDDKSNTKTIYTPYSAKLEAGDFTITFPVNGINFYGFKFVADSEETTPTAVSNISAEKSAKVFKTVENGQMIIVKNGVKYNVLGQIVK